MSSGRFLKSAQFIRYRHAVTSIVRSLAVKFAKSVWFRPGLSRRCFIGPYAGLTFYISPPLRHRMSIFYKAYEPEVTELLGRRLKPGMTFCNVGAHVGIHALYAAKRLADGGSVFAFEAWPENFRLLQRNMCLNESAKTEMHAIHCAVKEEEGVARMVQGGKDGTHHLSDEKSVSSVEVEAAALDSFFGKIDACPDFLLIDVEGAEIDVLRGARRLVKSTKPELLLEHHGIEARGTLAGWLTQRGYNTNSLGERHLHAW